MFAAAPKNRGRARSRNIIWLALWSALGDAEVIAAKFATE